MHGFSDAKCLQTGRLVDTASAAFCTELIRKGLGLDFEAVTSETAVHIKIWGVFCVELRNSRASTGGRKAHRTSEWSCAVLLDVFMAEAPIVPGADLHMVSWKCPWAQPFSGASRFCVVRDGGLLSTGLAENFRANQSFPPSCAEVLLSASARGRLV